MYLGERHGPPCSGLRRMAILASMVQKAAPKRCQENSGHEREGVKWGEVGYAS